MAGVVTREAYVDESSWQLLVEWVARIAVGLLPVLARRPPATPQAAAARALRRLPAGGEAWGTLPDGSTWYVRVPGRGGEPHGC